MKASKALLAHIAKSSAQQTGATSRRNLLHEIDSDDDAALEGTPIWLTLTTKRHISGKTRLQPGKILLPHPLNSDENQTICLITADPQRVYKDIVASEEFPAQLRKRVTRVIGFTKLKAKYSQYDAQRKLFSEHDIFLADDRIINRLPKVMGKTFFKTTQKRPIPVVLQPKQRDADNRGSRGKRDRAEGGLNAAPAAKMAREIGKALNSALVSLSPTTNTAVRIGWATFTPEQIADNVDAVVTSLVDKWVAEKWRNVRSIYIKGPETAALPIWLTDELWMGDKDVIAGPAQNHPQKPQEGKKKRKGEPATTGTDEEPRSKKKKSQQAGGTEVLPEGNDAQLNRQIAERKAKLKKQKSVAKKAMGD